MRKKWASRLLAMMLTGVTVVSMMPANIAHAEEADGQQGTTYYVMMPMMEHRRKKRLKRWIKLMRLR